MIVTIQVLKFLGRFGQKFLRLCHTYKKKITARRVLILFPIVFCFVVDRVANGAIPHCQNVVSHGSNQGSKKKK